MQTIERSRHVSPVLTVNEAVDYTRLCRATLYTFMRDGKLARLKVGGRTLIAKSDLDRLLGLAEQISA